MTAWSVVTRRPVQASDVPDEAVLAVVRQQNAADRWATNVDIAEALPGFPRKVLLAKCRSLIRRGLMTGCGCGCRGDYRDVS